MEQLEPLIPVERIAQRIDELGREIRGAYEPAEPLLCVGVLRGAFIFMADLVRAIPGPVECDFVTARSYEGTTSTGTVATHLDLLPELAGRHVLLVEDIVDTGRTVATLVDQMAAHAPASLSVVTLLDKPSRREVAVSVRWVGFAIEDRFVVGYGLDLDGRYRSLPYVAVVQ